MADNLKYNEPGSGPLVRTDQVGTDHYQVVKIDLGGDGVSIPVDGKFPITIVSGTNVGLTAGTTVTVDQGLGAQGVTNQWLVSGTLNIDGVQTSIEIKFVRVNATADGDNTIISGVTGKKIRVLGYVITVTTAGTITMQDTAGSPVIFGQFSLAAQGGASYAGGLMCPAFETAVGTGVEINTQTGQDCLGHMTYQEI